MPLWKNYCFHQKPHYSPNLPHHSKVSKRRVVSFLTLGHTESSTFGAIDKRETALACQMVIFTEQTKTFPVLPLLKQIMLSVLRVTLARAGWELQGGGAGQWWSWLLWMLQRCQGTGCHHTITPCCSSDWQSHGARAAWPAVRAFRALQMWAETPWGEKKLITLQTLIFEALLSPWCLSDFHCSVGCQPLLWRCFKIVSPVSDLLTLSRYHQDCFCFHCRGEELKSVKGLFTLSSPSAPS